SGIDYVKALIGRVAMVPLKLRRVATETHHEEKKQTHYTLQLVMDANIDAINMLRSDTIRVLEHTSRIALPEPLNENPELDPPDIIVDDDIPAELGNPLSDSLELYLLPAYDKGEAVKCPALKLKIRPKTDCEKCEAKTNCEAWGITGKVAA
ncbi:MAG: hypothetical protein WC554_18600, partial [Clostridia bacterium]